RALGSLRRHVPEHRARRGRDCSRDRSAVRGGAACVRAARLSAGPVDRTARPADPPSGRVRLRARHVGPRPRGRARPPGPRQLRAHPIFGRARGGRPLPARVRADPRERDAERHRDRSLPRSRAHPLARRRRVDGAHRPVNAFLVAATALLALELPLLVFAMRASRLDALVAVDAGATIFTLALVLLAQGFHRSAYTVLGLVAAVLTFAGSMVFVRFFERELEP